MTDETVSPIVEAVEPVPSTVADPSTATLVADIETAIKLVDELKTKLSGVHPSILDLFKAIF